MIKMNFSFVTRMGQRKNSESPVGIEPMASQIPVGRFYLCLIKELEFFFLFLPDPVNFLKQIN